MKKVFSTLSFLAFLASFGNCQVHINEYSTSNRLSFLDSFEKTEDWIELYNTSDEAVDISGWHLSDKESKPGKWKIPQGTIMAPKSHLVFLCSGRDLEKDGEYHTNFKLAQTKGNDIVLLADADENVIEMFPLELTLVEHSRCRVIDGSEEWAVSTSPSFGSSNDDSPQVNAYTARPAMNLSAGFYEGTQMLELTNNEPNSVLRYTLDGTNPTDSSPEYTEALSISKTTVVKAQSFSLDPMILPGLMEFNTYFIDESFTLAVYSVAADDVIDLANGQGELIPIGSLEYFDQNQERKAASFGELNRHGQDSWVLDHRSLDWISRDEMGYSKSIDAPIFNYSERDEYQRIMFRNSGDDNYPAIDDFEHEGSTHIRDEYVHTLGQLGGMKLDQRAVERVILFLNGEYWGLYGMREKAVDHDYTNEYYNQGKYDLQYLTTWDVTETQYGGLDAISDWEKLRNFILQNDMSIDENYKMAEDSLNMLSLIDYFILNMNVVAVDWLNYNTGWWRGLDPDGDHKKWGYIIWDLDATFDYYINYTGVPDESPNADPCDIQEISQSMNDFFGTGVTNHGAGEEPETPDCETVRNGSSPYPNEDQIFQVVTTWEPRCCNSTWDDDCQDLYDDIVEDPAILDWFFGYDGNVGSHEKIFTKLLNQNAEFRQLYLGRYNDLMNTVFSCENMNTLLDSMLAVIEPEMPRQIARWGGTMEEWQSNVEDLKDFINRRCDLLDDTAMDCFLELEGPYELTLMTEPAGVGEIDLNTLDIEEFPWVGSYFGGMEHKIKAKVFDDMVDDYDFGYWRTSSGSMIFPDKKDRRAFLSLTSNDTITAVFIPEGTVSTTGLENDHNVNLYPNPVKNELFISYELSETQDLSFDLFSLSGKSLQHFNNESGLKTSGKQITNLKIREDIPSGLYMLVLNIGQNRKTFKVNISK